MSEEMKVPFLGKLPLDPRLGEYECPDGVWPSCNLNSLQQFTPATAIKHHRSRFTYNCKLFQSYRQLYYLGVK